jgi:hypothetical protein
VKLDGEEDVILRSQRVVKLSKYIQAVPQILDEGRWDLPKGLNEVDFLSFDNKRKEH